MNLPMYLFLQANAMAEERKATPQAGIALLALEPLFPRVRVAALM